MAGKKGPPKGVSNNPNGRPKGSGNKELQRAREVVTAFVDNNAPLLEELLVEIRRDKGAYEAFKCIEGLLDYCIPRLARVESKHEGEVKAIINWPVGQSPLDG